MLRKRYVNLMNQYLLRYSNRDSLQYNNLNFFNQISLMCSKILIFFYRREGIKFKRAIYFLDF